MGNEIQGIDQMNDVQRNRARGVSEHGSTSTVQNQPQPSPQQAEQVRALGGNDTVKMSEEAMQAIHGRSVPDTQNVTALKDALMSMMHERPQGDLQSSSGAFGQSEQSTHDNDRPSLAQQQPPQEAARADDHEFDHVSVLASTFARPHEA